MLSRSLCLLAGLLPAGSALAVELAPHRGVYDLSLAEHTLGLTGVEGRIAIDLSAPSCEAYDLDYRFVARFGEEDEVTLTDQRILASRRFEIRQPSASPQLESVVAAFGQATDELSRQLQDWTIEVAKRRPAQ